MNIASLKLHGHPQRDVYTDRSQWLKPSFQSHFSLNDDNPVESSHVHVEPVFPQYAELGPGEIEIPFTVQLHHFHGRLTSLFGENLVRVIWDKTGTENPPPMVGDPEGDLLWTGVATLDISKAKDSRFAKKAPGWAISRFGARVYFGDVMDDGNRADVCGWCGYYSVVNPNLPEVPAEPAGAYGHLSCRVDTYTPKNKNDIGTMVMEYQGFAPVSAISAPWSVPISCYNYTGNRETAGSFDVLRDIDFHHGNVGELVSRDARGRGGINRTVTFDPLVIGKGTHKVAVVWRQSLDNEFVWSLVTLPITVGDVTMPPPELCTDPKADNFGHPLPCIYAPPADPFVDFAPRFKLDPATGRLKVYREDGTLVGEVAFK